MNRFKKKEIEFKSVSIAKHLNTNIRFFQKMGVNDVQNIKQMSETDVSNIWHNLNTNLLDIKKNINFENENTSKQKEYLKYVECIAEIALETILFHHKFISNDLIQIAVLLNSLFPKILDNNVRNTVSRFLEKWWSLNLAMRETVILNALNFLLDKSKNSVQYVQRLETIKDALKMKSKLEEITDIVDLIHKECVLTSPEGLAIITELFSFGKTWILAIHEEIKTCFLDDNCDIKVFSQIYYQAYMNANAENKKTILENCLKDYLFHSLRSNRTVNGRDKLGKNLFILLKYFHAFRNVEFKKSMCALYTKYLWNHLQATGSAVRCNAGEILFSVYPMLPEERETKRSKFHLQKQHTAMTKLLEDKNKNVCLIAVKGIFSLKWTNISDVTVTKWLEILVNLVRTETDEDIRCKILEGFKSNLSRNIKTDNMEYFLRKLQSLCYDLNHKVKVKFLEILLLATNFTNIKFWNIIPLSCILDPIDHAESDAAVKLSIKLLENKLKSNNNYPDSVSDIVRFGIINQNAMRIFLLHSLDLDMAFDLIKEILSIIFKKTKYLMEEYETDVNFDGNTYTNKLTNLNMLSMFLFEACAIILYSKKQELSDDLYKHYIKDVTDMLSKNASTFCKYIMTSSNIEAAIFFCSLLPSTQSGVVDTCLELLLNSNNNSDIVCRIIDLLIKWNKINDIFNLLIKLFNNSSNVSELLLGLNILQILVNDNFKQVLIRKHHGEVAQFWTCLNVLQIIENKVINNELRNSALNNILLDVFTVYLYLIDTLHKSHDFDASEHLYYIINWALRIIVPVTSSESSDLVLIDFCNTVLKNIFQVTNTLISVYKVTPKICYSLVILYGKCMSIPNGIDFINYALDSVLALLNYNNNIFKNNEADIEDVTTKLWLLLMMILTKFNETSINNHTKDFQSFQQFFCNLFLLIKNPSTTKTYALFTFNTAVICLSRELKKHLKSDSIFKYIEEIQIPYVTKRISNLFFDSNQLQELYFDSLDDLTLNYSDIDELSMLLILKNGLDNNKDLFSEIVRFYLTYKGNLLRERVESDTTIVRLTNHVRTVLIKTIEK